MKRKLVIYKKVAALFIACACLITGCSSGSEEHGSKAEQDERPNHTASSGEGQSALSENEKDGAGEDSTGEQAAAGEKFDVVVEFSKKQLDSDYEKENLSHIHLSDTGISVDGSGMMMDNQNSTTLRITEPGTYMIDGSCSDGQIIVETELAGYVWLVLNNASLTCTTGPAIYVENAENTKLTLAEGTKNLIADGDNYDSESQAAIFSKDDLVINGSGSLTVQGNKNHGIQSKDDLRIVEGSITIETVGDGIVGKDSVELKTPVLNVKAGGDGIKSTNTEANRGYIYMENPAITIEAEQDGIQAETCLMVLDGKYDILTGGGSVNASTDAKGDQNPGWGNWGGGRPEGGMRPERPGMQSERPGVSPEQPGMSPEQLGMPAEQFDMASPDTESLVWYPTAEKDSSERTVNENSNPDANNESENTSAKGLKAGFDITLTGGTFTLDTSDDSIHSNGSILIKAGAYNIQSGDDGMHSDKILEIAGGTIDIQKSYEGIESGEVIIREGTITCVSSDDGLNVAGGNDASSMNGRPGQNPFAADSSCKLTIYGGIMYFNASGDGLDSNGSIEINGGNIQLDGPTNGGNGSLDYGTECNINGGELILTGSVGMAEAPTGGSQNSFLVTADCNAKAVISIQDSKGEELISYSPAKACQSIVYSSPKLKQGETYNILVDGTVATTITLDDTVTSSGNGSGFGMPGGMGGMGGRPSFGRK